MEWRAHKRGRADEDRLAYRILAVAFVVTTSVGALTGVGIWFSTSLVNPAAIGSLIRVFFSAWFTEWIVFVVEVVAIMIYFLTWKRMTGPGKGRHIAIGVVLSVFSWLTMAIIVAILGFMMDPGSWKTSQSFLSGVFNPIYLPQLAFRTPFAAVAAGMFVLFAIHFLSRKNDPAREATIRLTCTWSLAWVPVLLAGSVWYRTVVPGWMFDNAPVALTTQAFTTWYDTLLEALLLAMVGIVAVSLWGLAKPRSMPAPVMLVPLVLAFTLLGSFERVREFIRKPYVIEEYMYANGIRVEDYPLLLEEGVLAHATYASTRTITKENELEAGQDVFMLTCTRCHTTVGVNGVVGKLEDMYGSSEWNAQTVQAFIRNMHNARPYMPPFPGNDDELAALVSYVSSQRAFPSGLPGAQSTGVALPDAPSAGRRN